MTSFLPCPECGADVTDLPARQSSEFWGMNEPYWFDGDDASCKCGAKLVVEADGERAWLKTIEDAAGEGEL